MNLVLIWSLTCEKWTTLWMANYTVTHLKKPLRQVIDCLIDKTNNLIANFLCSFLIDDSSLNTKRRDPVIHKTILLMTQWTEPQPTSIHTQHRTTIATHTWQQTNRTFISMVHISVNRRFCQNHTLFQQQLRRTFSWRDKIHLASCGIKLYNIMTTNLG